jgi:tetratricopeptide (TPR) repeat protein
MKKKILIEKSNHNVSSLAYLLTISLLLSISSSLFCYDFTSGGVRNAAMGGAGTASSNDASSIVWNPAFLGDITWYQLISDSRTYTIKLDNDQLSDNFAYFSVPLGRLGSIGLSAGMNGSENYNETRLGMAYGTASLSRALVGKDNKLLFGFGFQNYRTGYSETSNHYIDGSTLSFEETNNAIDADLGIVYRPTDFLQIGAAVNRLLSANMALEDSGSDKLPRIVSAGAQLSFESLILCADYSLEQGDQVTDSYYAVGAEYKVAENMFLRAGFNTGNITAGVGIDVYRRDWLEEIDNYVDGIADVTSLSIGIDYAFQTPFMDNELEADFGNHYFGVRLSYGKRTVSERELTEMFPEQYSSGLNLDSLYFARVKADTVFREVTLYDTLRVVERVADEDIVNERVSQEAERIKLEQVGDINRASVYLIRALEYFYAEQYTRAIDQCERAIAIAPNLSMSYLRLASIYVALSENEQALEYVRQGLRIDPGNEELLRLMEKINE